MIAYIDSSVLLRIVLGQPDRLKEWGSLVQVVTSALTEVECLRTLDRRRRLGLHDDRELADRRGLALRLLEHTERVDVSPAVLRRAAEPFPTPLRTLDALHLATASLWGQGRPVLPAFATHDIQQATAARALGFATLGV